MRQRRKFGILGAVVLWAAAFSGPAQAAPGDNEPIRPFQIAHDLHYVGASDIAAYLIRTDKGLILIDGGYETTAPQILTNIRRLGFDPRQVKILLNTHAHLDHAGGLAQLKRETGARLYASAEDGALMARGGKGDFFFGDRLAYPPVKPDRIVHDGEKVRLGWATLTAHLTPGHTKGCTTWTFAVDEGVVPEGPSSPAADGKRQVLILCSNTVLPGYRLVGNEAYPKIAADYERSYRFWRSAPCEIFLASHGRFFGMAEKRRAAAMQANPFVDPQGCKAFFDKGYADFRAELAKQQGR